MATDSHPLPTEDEVLTYFDRCSNWGRWGPGDSAGTINLITPEKRKEAARLVTSGRAVSLARQWNTVGGPGNQNPAQHYVRTWREASVDYIGISYHGYATTHIDALCHIFWDGKMWNGKDSMSEVTSLGAKSGDVSAWSNGITTRGALLDIPRLRGTEYVDVDNPVRGYELLAAAEAEGIELRPGDAVCVYSGREKFYAANPEHVPGGHPSPGLHVDTVPVLKDKDAALLVWDLMDAGPCGYQIFDSRMAGLGVHVLAIVFMGMPLLDNSLLQPLAEACSDERTWEFMLTVNPLNIRGGTGSPVNPIAVF
ncbi:MAG: cyclase family protein [Dehalococcoidia bacterium]|nr:cyclase family protein [Dehalococcoidia bacterium]